MSIILIAVVHVKDLFEGCSVHIVAEIEFLSLRTPSVSVCSWYI